MNKFFINLDELSDMNGDNFRSKFDIIKNLTTENMLNIEIKNGPQFTHPNYMNIIMCTNHLHTIKMEKDDGRYFVLECNPFKRGDRAYFNQLEGCFNQDAANHFVTYLIQYNTTIDLRDIPMTKLKQDMIDSQMDSVEQFIEHINELLESKTIDIELDICNGLVKSTDLYEFYTRCCLSSGEKPYTKTKFGVRVSSVYTKGRRNNGIFYTLY
jgi:phage/plasmid-associated DNA primase